MQNYYHTFHIPVMGTGHSIDTPIRIAPLGITSVISLVDDILLEKIRKYYCEKFCLPYSRIQKNAVDGRAKRTTAYLDMVHEIIQIKMKSIRKQPFFEKNDKTKYFDLLPDKAPLKIKYNEFIKMDIQSLQKSGLSELESLYNSLQHSFSIPSGCFSGSCLLRLDQPGSRRPLWFGSKAFEYVPFGIDFDNGYWYFFHPKLRTFHFRP